MQHLKRNHITTALIHGITGYSRENATTGLEQDETSQTENQREVRNQPEVRANQEMLDRFNDHQRNGSNIFLNYPLIRKYDFQTVKPIVKDYQTITLEKLLALGQEPKAKLLN